MKDSGLCVTAQTNTHLPALNQQRPVHIPEPHPHLTGRKPLQFDAATTQEVGQTAEELTGRGLKTTMRRQQDSSATAHFFYMKAAWKIFHANKTLPAGNK